MDAVARGQLLVVGSRGPGTLAGMLADRLGQSALRPARPLPRRRPGRAPGRGARTVTGERTSLVLMGPTP